ncbi:MAG: biopolymer transporter ExbD [Piscinibacter sp.]|uniref:ExbD/TolR family protein n=1 Tax=Piscinibacter TaxID=1114981 RepID=UPI000FDE45A1|nr:MULTISPECIES: biopolymer transporter ExbD [Piscinibacter]MCW5665374.1 biopolymer transporter ExbD [Piscinibacter sp.]
MAFGRLERTPGPQPMSDINMTPLIDVMLVLLVIFMITAPLLSASLKLDLPQAEGAQPPGEAVPALLLSMDADGALFLGDERIDEATLRERAAALARANPQAELQLRADRRVPYGRVAGLIGLVQQAGLSRIAFVAEPPAR